MSAGDVIDEPYPGLRSFRRDETHIFFGRESTINEMVQRLSAHRFLAVTGTSGSGKSSLVRTGLLDALERGLLVTPMTDWRVADFRPGRHPLAALATALLDATDSQKPEHEDLRIEAMLARGPLGLVEWLKETELSPKTNILLLADQFEEIFRFQAGEAGDEINAFVALLLASAAQRDWPIYVVITMRSDFLGECAQFSGLAEAINDGQFLTPRLTRDQCREAIEGPAAVYGGKVEPALVNRLLNDMGTNADQLPLVQHVLMRLWRLAIKRDGAPLLTLDDYLKLGGISTTSGTGHQHNALSAHADEILTELTVPQQRIASILFRAVTESQGEGGRDVRRPTALGEIAEIAGVRVDDVIPVVEAFRAPGRNLLTPPPNVPLTADTVIDISHESLIRQWDTLRSWLRQEYDAARTYRHVEATAALWQGGESGLLTMPYLGVARDWRDQEAPNAVWAARYGNSFSLAMEFLDQSIQAEHDRVAAEERAHRRATLRTRAVAATMAVLFLIASTAAYFGFEAAKTAERNAQRAKENAERAEQNALAAERNLQEAEQARKQALQQSNSALFGQSVYLAELSRKKFEERDFLKSLLFAVEAMPDQRWNIDRPLVREATNMLAQGYHYLASQKALASSAVRLNALEILPDSRVVTIGDDGVIRVVEAPSGRSIAQLVGHVGPIGSIDVSNNGKLFATSGEDGTVRVWDAASGQQTSIVIRDVPMNSVRFMPDGAELMSAGADNVVRFWDAASGRQLRQIAAPGGKLQSAIPSPDGSQVVTMSEKIAQVWDTRSGKMLKSLEVNDREDIARVIYTADGSAIVTVGEFKNVTIWNARTFSQIKTITLDEFIGPVVSSPDGRLIGIGSKYDHIATSIVDAQSGAILRVLDYPKTVSGMMFLPDSSRVVTGSDDSTIRIWDFRSGKELASKKLDGTVRIIKILPDGKTIAATTGRAIYFLDQTLNQIGKVDSPNSYGDRIWLDTDGHRAISIPREAPVSAWDTEARKRLNVELPGNLDQVASIAASRDGRLIGFVQKSGRIDIRSSENLQIKNSVEDTIGETAAFTPDGRQLAATVGSTRIEAYEDGQGLRGIPSVDELFDTRVMRLSRSGRWLFTAGIGAKGRLWDLASRRLVATLLEPGSSFSSDVAFTSDETRLIVRSENGRLRQFDVGNGAEIAELATGVQSASFSQSRLRMATRTKDDELAVWDLSTVKPLLKRTIAAKNITLSSDGSRLLLRDQNEFDVLDAATGKTVGTLKLDKDKYIWPYFSADGSRLVYESDRSVAVWEAQTGAQVTLSHTWPTTRSIVTIFNSDASRITVWDADGSADLFDGRTGTHLAELSRRGDGSSARPAGEFSKDGNRLLYRHVTGRLELWDAKAGKRLQILVDAPKHFVPFGFSGDSRFALSSDDVSALDAWDAGTGAKTAALASSSGRVTSFMTSDDGSRVTSNTETGIASVWNLRSFAKEAEFRIPTSGRSMFSSDDGKRIAVLARGVNTALFDIGAAKPAAVLTGKFTGNDSVSSNGSLIATVDDHDVRIWDLPGGHQSAQLETHPSAVTKVIFSPDGGRVVTVAQDKIARLWNTKAGTKIAELTHPGEILDIQYSADGTRILTRSEANLLLWQASDGQRIAELGAGKKYQAVVLSPDSVSVAAFTEREMVQYALKDGSRMLEISLPADNYSSRFSMTDDAFGRLVSSTDGSTIASQRSGAVWPMLWAPQDYVDRIKETTPRCLTRDEREALYLDPAPPLWCVEMVKWPYIGPKWQEWLADKKNKGDAPLPEGD